MFSFLLNSGLSDQNDYFFDWSNRGQKTRILSDSIGSIGVNGPEVSGFSLVQYWSCDQNYLSSDWYNSGYVTRVFCFLIGHILVMGPKYSVL